MRPLEVVVHLIPRIAHPAIAIGPKDLPAWGHREREGIAHPVGKDLYLLKIGAGP